MNRPASPIARWKEIILPLFWPVLFRHLRKFARYLRLRIGAGGKGLISRDLTWRGAIGICQRVVPDVL